MDIWRRPKFLPYQQPHLTNDMIFKAESKMGVKLPFEYLEMLKIQNGGYIRYTLPETIHSKIDGIGPHYPSITNFEWLLEYDDLSFEVAGLFPFDGESYWNICLDYRDNNNEPKITVISIESDCEEVIAQTFKDYLDMLIIDAEDEYLIEPNLKFKDVIERIEKKVKIKFDEPDSTSHGYPIYRSAFKNSWIWLYSNKVPKGFVRDFDDRYEELKTQKEAMTLKYPEVSEDSIFITMIDEEERLELFNTISHEGINVIPLRDKINNKPNR